MKEKETVFIVRGCDLDSLTKDAMREMLLTFSNINAINIGSSTTGFNHKKLTEMFGKHLTGKEKEINIYIDMHGAPGTVVKKDPGKYYLSTERGVAGGQTIVPVDKILPELVKATNDKPLKIFASSCYGKYFQQEKYLKMLPKGSMLITLSGNGETKLFDEHLFNESMSHLFKQSITTEGNSIENLLKTYCMNQKVKQYDPIIGLHKQDDTIEKFKVGSFIKTYAENHNEFSSFFELVATEDIVSKELMLELIATIKSDENADIKNFKPKLPAWKLVNELETKTVEEFKTWLEAKYYPKGTLQALNFNKLLQYKEALEDFNKEQSNHGADYLLPWFTDQYTQMEAENNVTINQIREHFNLHKKGNQELSTLYLKQNTKISEYKKIIDQLTEIQSQNLSESELQGKQLYAWAVKKHTEAEDAAEQVREQWQANGKMSNKELSDLLGKKCEALKEVEGLRNITWDFSLMTNAIFCEQWDLVSNHNILLAQGAEAALDYVQKVIGEGSTALSHD